jgi:hypothetical protein
MTPPFDREGRASKNSPVDCFSEGASRRTGKQIDISNLMVLVWPRPLTVAAGYPLFEDSVKIQRCLTPKAFGGVRWISEWRK